MIRPFQGFRWQSIFFDTASSHFCPSHYFLVTHRALGLGELWLSWWAYCLRYGRFSLDLFMRMERVYLCFKVPLAPTGKFSTLVLLFQPGRFSWLCSLMRWLARLSRMCWEADTDLIRMYMSAFGMIFPGQQAIRDAALVVLATRWCAKGIRYVKT